MIKSSEIKEYNLGSISPGDSKRFNHKGCASTASSNSLQIWRENNGSINAFCFKCNQSGRFDSLGNYQLSTKQENTLVSRYNHISLQPALGSIPSGSSRRGNEARRAIRRGKENDSKPSPKEKRRSPLDTTYVVDNFSVDARIKLCAYITKKEIEENLIGYSRKNNSIIYNCNSGPTPKDFGYVQRTLDGHSNRPKYLSRYSVGSFFATKHNKSRNVLFVVEDVLSAIVCGRLGTGAALMGINRWEVLSSLAPSLSSFSSIYIYLDNDNSNVLRARRKIYNYCKLYNENVKIIKETRDPKELSTSELKELIK